jgi:3'-phosphoadenosine 5'-phosphosulfate sulfotransferase (PAPS reductase)/FAD synthetase
VNKHQAHDLKQMQSLPLEAKIIMTQQRIRQWYDHWEGEVYVSFSGGKDSTVLKHIVDNTPGVYDVPAVFVNTGLEYPEIQKFVKDVKAGKWDCFNSNVIIVRPEMRFDEVVKTYGYPVISKRVANAVDGARRNPNGIKMKQMLGIWETNGKLSMYNYGNHKYLLNADFKISEKCCSAMKKKPLKKYHKESGRIPIIATMACESENRRMNWIKYGCNAFGSKNPTSTPMSFWTEQDVLHYIKKFNVPYCPVYGDIHVKPPEGSEEGQMNVIDYLGCWDETDILETTGCDRTGCIFCMFGCHLEKEPNRFQRLKETHPRQYEYCIGGGEMVDGKWQPSKEGLGLGHVLDYIGVKYD